MKDIFQHLLLGAAETAAVPAVIVYPTEHVSMHAVALAMGHGLIEPIFVGPHERMMRAAHRVEIPRDRCRFVDASSEAAAAATAVTLARDHATGILVKGDLHTDVLMHAVTHPDSGMHTDRRMSHAFLMHIPSYRRPVIVTDAALNIAPSLEDKRDILQNAINLAHAIGIRDPKAAVLAAVETVNPHMPAAVEAAALCKMAERGQLFGARVDGPLALDDALSIGAAHEKGITSPVAGLADILLVPDIESGNILYKALIVLGDAVSAGIVMGARLPVALAGRADALETRTASIALAAHLAQAPLALHGHMIG